MPNQTTDPGGSVLLAGSFQDQRNLALRKVQNCNSNFDNGVRNGTISILKWDKILEIVVGFTIMKFPFSLWAILTAKLH